jgi:hypothetical protein
MPDEQPVEAIAIVWRRGWWCWRRWAGKLEFRRLVTPYQPFDSFWIEWAKGSSDGLWAPLVVARSREALVDKLRVHAESIGPLHTFRIQGRR